jgi:hypothetical protein
MRKTAWIVLVISLVAAFEWLGCKPNYNFGPERRRLDSLSTQLETVWGNVQTHWPDSLSEWSDTLHSMMTYIQSHYKGTMPLSMALELSSWKHVQDRAVEASAWKTKLETLFRAQLDRFSTLRAAIDQKADKDADGNPFTPEYVDRALADEDAALDHFALQANSAEQALDHAHQLYGILLPRMQHLSDSLKTNKP